MNQNDFPYYLSKFFQSYLPGSRNVSVNTVLSYRDTFTKLLTYLRDTCSIAPDKVSFRDLDRNTIEDFLSYLENDQGCSISTRNQRLAGLRSFFRFAEVERPDLLADCQAVLSIKNKKCPKPVIDYLSGSETELLLSQPDASSAKGRRDLALLSLMYDSAARVQEICDLKAGNVRLDSPAVVRLYGKGRKTRDVPLDAPCVHILRRYMAENRLDRKEMQHMPLFFNSRKEKLSRSGVSYILSKYTALANEHGGSIPDKITPHCLRHSKAMHMVEAGINLIYIRDVLGHESIETTQVYAKANPETRRAALEKMENKTLKPPMPDWKDDPSIMDFLHGLK
jgi:site-specific recombinase XerD